MLDTLHQLELPQGALLHSDQGSVYTSKAYYQACIEKGITRSMSRKGTPADNACIEWFHSVLKSETFYLHKWKNLTKDSITDIVKDYIIFYSRLNIESDNIASKIFIEIALNSLINLFRFYFNLLYNETRIQQKL